MQKPNANREKIIELLEHAGGVTEDSVREVHEQTGIPEADIWGTGLFYTLLREPGQRIRLCDGLTCQMFGADSLAMELTDAGKSVERVSCLGQCDLAPASLDEAMELVTYAKHKTAISHSRYVILHCICRFFERSWDLPLSPSTKRAENVSFCSHRMSPLHFSTFSHSCQV